MKTVQVLLFIQCGSSLTIRSHLRFLACLGKVSKTSIPVTFHFLLCTVFFQATSYLTTLGLPGLLPSNGGKTLNPSSK